MLLHSYGNVDNPVRIRVFFECQSARSGLGSVLVCLPSRRSAARWLWRFRRARLWWRSDSCANDVSPIFGMRWLAARWCRLLVFAPSSVPNSRISFSTLVLPGFLSRPLSYFSSINLR